MKRILLIGALRATSVPALAADLLLPAPAPAYAPALARRHWTGFMSVSMPAGGSAHRSGVHRSDR